MGATAGLFRGRRLAEEAEDRIAAAEREVERVDVERLLAEEPAELVEDFLDAFEPVAIRWADVTMTEPQAVTLPARRDALGQIITPRAFQAVVTVPLDGEAILLTYQADSGHPLSGIEGQASPGRVTFTWTGDLSSEPTVLTAWFERRRQEVERFVVHVNRDAEALNVQMRRRVEAAIVRRVGHENARRQLVSALPFPLERRPDATRPVRVQRRTVRLEHRPVPRPFAPEPAIEGVVYEEILRDCAAMARIFERMPVGDLQEEDLRNLLLGMLNTNYTGQVAGELFNGAGKTDICVRHGDRNVFIAECKFYRGPASVVAAMDQLLSYLVWRDSKAALLLFVRGGNFTQAVQRAVEAVEQHDQRRRTVVTATATERSDFEFARADDPERPIHVAVLPFRIPSQTDGAA